MSVEPDERAFELRLEWDDDEKIATLYHRDVTLADEADVQRWRDLVLAELDRVYARVGERFPLLVDMHGFVLKPRCVHAFGEVIVSEVRGRYVNAHARFGRQARTRQAVAIAAMKTGVEANIFDTRAEALADIRRQLAVG